MAEGEKAAAKAAKGDKEEKAEAKTKKDAKPEGYVSPVLFAKLWSAHRAGKPATLEAYAELDEKDQVRPQIIYGYIRNNAAFAEAAASQNTDDHWMINVKAGLAFLTERDKTKAAKAATKAADDAKEAAESQS